MTERLDSARQWLGARSAEHSALLTPLLQAFDWAYGKAIDGMPGLEGAEELAASYAARHADTDAAINALINWHTGMASVAGFLTGIGGFVALPVAIPANLASALYIQVRLIAAIAHLRGHDLRSPQVRALVLACLTGSKAADTLKDAGVRFGTRLGRDVIGWASPAIFHRARHAAGGKAVVTAAGSVARLGRFVPLFGGLVAGGVDGAMTRMIGRTAARVFTGTTAETAPTIDQPMNEIRQLPPS
ncbi:MAG TPA: EcsC family protein [Stellaceae bacterium]|nr:EcsC family protein [Stellaceae bacterium]